MVRINLKSDNHLFSPVALLDGSGDIAERYEYNAYGKVQVLTDSDGDGNWFDDAGDVVYGSSQAGNPYLFTGRRLDVLDSGDYEIMYYRNRYYNTYTGRFLTQDPLGINPGRTSVNYFRPLFQNYESPNLYEYVSSKPPHLFDAFGLWESSSIFDGRVSEERWEQKAPSGTILVRYYYDYAIKVTYGCSGPDNNEAYVSGAEIVSFNAVGVLDHITIILLSGSISGEADYKATAQACEDCPGRTKMNVKVKLKVNKDSYVGPSYRGIGFAIRINREVVGPYEVGEFNVSCCARISD